MNPRYLAAALLVSTPIFAQGFVGIGAPTWIQSIGYGWTNSVLTPPPFAITDELTDSFMSLSAGFWGGGTINIGDAYNHSDLGFMSPSVGVSFGPTVSEATIKEYIGDWFK